MYVQIPLWLRWDVSYSSAPLIFYQITQGGRRYNTLYRRRYIWFDTWIRFYNVHHFFYFQFGGYGLILDKLIYTLYIAEADWFIEPHFNLHTSALQVFKLQHWKTLNLPIIAFQQREGGGSTCQSNKGFVFTAIVFKSCIMILTIMMMTAMMMMIIEESWSQNISFSCVFQFSNALFPILGNEAKKRRTQILSQICLILCQSTTRPCQNQTCSQCKW